MRLILKPDWDPSNPYHYHVNGQKIVITPEDWEKYKDDPTFREVRQAVEAEQAAHPEPEYDEVENPAWIKAYQNLVNGVNLKGRSNYLQPLPQGYTRDSKRVPMDAQGNYYLPVETATDAPYFINQERGMMGHTVPVRYEQLQMPERTIKQLRLPLSVDEIINVDKAKENAVKHYMETPIIKYKFNSDALLSDIPFYFFSSKNGYADPYWNSEGIKKLHSMTNISWEKVRKEYNTAPYNVIYKYLNLDSNGYGSEKQIKDLKKIFEGLGYTEDFNEKFLENPPLFETVNVLPSRQEAEKKAVIKIGDLKKVGTFAKGGRLICKYLLGGYTILPGDTLSSIALKYNLNYKDIAAINGIADPNLINAGDNISLDTPSNTKDNLNGIKGRYINNYQDLHTSVKSKYDYFLGNNGELFYKLKGADKWIDISNNEKAKINLNNFIKNYSIGAKPQKPKSSFLNKIDLKRLLIKSPEIIIDDFEYNGVKSKNDYKLVGNKTYKRVKGTLNWIDISNDILSRKNLEAFINSKQSKLNNKQIEQYDYLLMNYLPGPYNPYHNSSVKSQENQRIIPISQYDSAIMSEAFGNLFTKGLSYFNRHYRNEEHSIVPEILTGEYKINYNGYSKPAISIKHKSADKFNSTLQAVDYDPNTFIFGTRNRGEYPIDADNVTLTTFNPFVDKDNPILKKYHSFIGISSNGKLKVSTNLNDFVGEGWKISPTYSNIITGFRRNEDGSLYLDKDYLKGTKTPDNPKHRIVWFNGIDDNGNAFDNGLLNVLTPVQDKNGNFATNYYGDIAGGKALFATDDGQMRLLSGSIEQIVAGFEEFLRSNPGKQIRMYTLDNGAYSKLLKKNQGYFTREDWNKYDNQHFGGGNVAYIKGNAALQLQFPSDTAYTLINNPSYTGIAKPNDTQVKKGHPITRKPQGIVLHQTATRMSAPNSEVLRAFQQNGTGANVVIGTHGQRTVLAPPDRVTYHAGYSAYQDGNTLLENLNDYFSGIEFVGEKRDLITDAQVQSAIEYLRPIIQQYKIYPNKLVTHELVRNAYNKLHNNSAPNKWDMNYKSYEKLMKAILNEIYYLKHGGKLIKR